jgi:hypothetical protein
MTKTTNDAEFYGGEKEVEKESENEETELIWRFSSFVTTTCDHICFAIVNTFQPWHLAIQSCKNMES